MSGTRSCPFCGGEIQAKAILCKHCRKSVEPVRAPPPPVAPQTEAPVSSACSAWSLRSDAPRASTGTGILTLASGLVLLFTFSSPVASVGALATLKLCWPLLGGILLALVGVAGLAVPVVRERTPRRWFLAALTAVVGVAALIDGLAWASSAPRFMTCWSLAGHTLLGAACVARSLGVLSHGTKQALGLGVILSSASLFDYSIGFAPPTAFLMFAAETIPSMVFIALGADVAAALGVYVWVQWLRRRPPSRRPCVGIIVSLGVSFISWIAWATSPSGAITLLTSLKVQRLVFWAIGCIAGALLLKELARPDEFEAPLAVSTPEVPRATAPSTPPANATPAPAAEAPAGSVEAALRELSALKAKGLVTDGEYAAKRDDILRRL